MKKPPPKVWPGAGGAGKPRPQPPEPTLAQLARRLDAIEKRLDSLGHCIDDIDIDCQHAIEMALDGRMVHEALREVAKHLRPEKKRPRPVRDKRSRGAR